MDKICQPFGDSSSSSSISTKDQYLKHLNKLSHKISKPTNKKTPFDPTIDPQSHSHNLNPHQQPQAQLQQPGPARSSQTQNQNLQPQQPPVFNINKNDFREVVQKLTGSPAQERFSSPPPIHPPKATSSRLHRFRPPPLAQVSNRPPSLLNRATGVPPQHLPNSAVTNHINPFGAMGRPIAPLSPLPPLPTVHAPADSPVSSYMRYLQNSMSRVDPNQKQPSGFSPLAPLVSSRWTNPLSPQQQTVAPWQQGMLPPPATQAPATLSSQSQFPMPSSPLSFGCMNSPKSPYPLLSPSFLFSPSSGQLGFPQLPLSPTVPNAKWRGF